MMYVIIGRSLRQLIAVMGWVAGTLGAAQISHQDDHLAAFPGFSLYANTRWTKFFAHGDCQAEQSEIFYPCKVIGK
jgi:hypothetical protein